MHCPFCHNPDSRVVDTRIADDGASIRRRRECTHCKKRFTTLETSSFQVVKRSGVVESFSRNKVVSGVKKACQGRPVSDDQLAILAQQVEEQLRSTGVSNAAPGADAPETAEDAAQCAPAPAKKPRKARSTRKRAVSGTPTLLGDD